LTIHPSGAVAIAPLFVCLPRVMGDARRRNGVTVAQLALVVSVGIAWTTLLAFVDFDLSSRDESIRLIQGAGHSAGLVQERDRYELLWQWGASPPRRELVAFLILSAAVALVAWRTKRDLLERLPSASVAIGLVLLAFAPSKWIWHFGVFTGLAVVAIGLESDRFDRGHVSARTRWVAAGVLLAVSLLAASDIESWGPLDGSGVNWDTIPFLALTGATALGALLLVRLRGGHTTPRPEAIVLVAVAVAVIGATTAALAAAAASSDEWTAARQLALSVTGRDTCGIADDVQIPDARSLERLEPWARPATVRADQRAIASTRGSRWYVVPDQLVGLFVRGDWDRQQLVVSWGKSNGKHVRVIASGPADLSRAQVGAINATWWFVTETSFPARPPGADLVRASVTSQSATSSREVSQPYSYEIRPLSGMVGRDQLTTLSSPYLFEALPCATLPKLERGVAEPPNLLIDGGPPPLTIAASPFLGVTDMFTVWKAPVESPSGRRSIYPWEKVVAYWVTSDPRDEVVPATRRPGG
jgi:cell wall arabinan synthesis protein